MKKIRVALVHINKPTGWNRIVGWWSYPVPQFEVTHFGVPKRFVLTQEDFKGHDLVFQEDHKTHGKFEGLTIPRVYHVVDSTLAKGNYKGRCEHAKGADLILVDHDRLERFTHLGPPVRRFGYCVNDKLFYDRKLPKDIDVSYHCRGWFPERRKLGEILREFCAAEGYSYATGKRLNVEYAKAFGRSKISVNLPINEFNRSHRTFDVMGSRACLSTKRLVSVSYELRRPCDHYVEWDTYDEMFAQIKYLVESGEWETIADAAYELVLAEHTWAVRAEQLYKTLEETIL